MVHNLFKITLTYLMQKRLQCNPMLVTTVITMLQTMTIAHNHHVASLTIIPHTWRHQKSTNQSSLHRFLTKCFTARTTNKL